MNVKEYVFCSGLVNSVVNADFNYIANKTNKWKFQNGLPFSNYTNYSFRSF